MGAAERAARMGGLTASVAASLLHQALFPILQRRMKGALTVLAYHRVIDLAAEAGGFRPNVSASPAGFAAQLDFLSRRYDVINAGDFVAWLEERGPLPPRPLLITFDDGYRDNFENAFPLLRERNLPAVIFLTSDFIGRGQPFLSDLAAWLFSHAARPEGRLPLLGQSRWDTQERQQAVQKQWLELLKALPDAEQRKAIAGLAAALEVAPPPDQFERLHVTWDQVRRMSREGIAMGGHTRTHAILTRVSAAEAESEISTCKDRIEVETGLPVRTFAYPNGQPGDFDSSTEAALRRHGFAAAFTLLPGPVSRAQARRRPLAIRRIFVSHKDDPARFALKLLGLPRVRDGIIGKA